MIIFYHIYCELTAVVTHIWFCVAQLQVCKSKVKLGYIIVHSKA